MSSHVAAFRILYGLRVRLSEHIGKLPLGYLNNTSTGAIKKTMDQNIEKIEGFIAHTIPDLVNVMATVVVMLVIFFSLDVWLTVVCLAVVVLWPLWCLAYSCNFPISWEKGQGSSWVSTTMHRKK